MRDEIQPRDTKPEQHRTDDPGQSAEDPASPGKMSSPQALLMQLPGLAAIGLYMLFLAGTVILGVATRHYPPLYLIFPVLFFAAGLGLLMFFRWAWALTVAAVVMLMALFLYQFTTHGALSAVVQCLLNLVFFLYLVRAQVRSRLR